MSQEPNRAPGEGCALPNRNPKQAWVWSPRSRSQNVRWKDAPLRTCCLMNLHDCLYCISKEATNCSTLWHGLDCDAPHRVGLPSGSVATPCGARHKEERHRRARNFHSPAAPTPGTIPHQVLASMGCSHVSGDCVLLQTLACSEAEALIPKCLNNSQPLTSLNHEALARTACATVF